MDLADLDRNTLQYLMILGEFSITEKEREEVYKYRRDVDKAELIRIGMRVDKFLYNVIYGYLKDTLNVDISSSSTIDVRKLMNPYAEIYIAINNFDTRLKLFWKRYKARSKDMSCIKEQFLAKTAIIMLQIEKEDKS